MKRLPFEKWSMLGPKLHDAQRGLYRVVIDGVEPYQLPNKEREALRPVLGDVDVIPPEARRVFAMVKGRGIGGTRLGAEALALIASTIDLKAAGLDRTELAYVWLGGPKLRHTRPALGFAKAVLRKHGATIEDESAEGFTLVRPDSYRVRFEAFAASRGGDNVRGVHIIGALMTEAGFYYDETGINNGEGIFSAMMPRLLKGGLIIIESSPWLESGLLWREFNQNWAEPKHAIAALCPTVVMRDDAETAAMVAAEYERDRETAERELGAQFIGGGAGLFFGQELLGPAVDNDLSIQAQRPEASRVVVGGDIGLVVDASAFVAISVSGMRLQEKLTVCDALELKPKKGSPLKLSQVVQKGCAFAGRYGSSQITVDHHELQAGREHLTGGIMLKPCAGGADAKEARFIRVRQLLREDRIRIPGPLSRIATQLSLVISKPKPGGGTSIILPRRAGTHLDLASAFVLAVDAGAKRMNPLVAAHIESKREKSFVEKCREADRPITWHDAYGPDDYR